MANQPALDQRRLVGLLRRLRLAADDIQRPQLQRQHLPYFVCAGRHAKRTHCTRPAILVEKVEQLVADHYKTIQIPPDVRQAMLGMLDEEFAALHASSEAERHQLTVERDRIQDQRRASLQAHYAGALPLDLLKEEQDRLAHQLDLVTVRLEALDTTYEEPGLAGKSSDFDLPNPGAVVVAVAAVGADQQPARSRVSIPFILATRYAASYWHGASVGAHPHVVLARTAPLVGWIAQLSLGVLGVLAITSECADGTIRTSVAALPRRHRLLAGKAVVVGAVSLVAARAVSKNPSFGGRTGLTLIANLAKPWPAVVRGRGQGMLLNRRREGEALHRLLEAARAGRSGALVVRGAPGIGKTALLEHLLESASDFRVARASGVESEMELAFAALHQLCAPMLDRLDRLPIPQRDALAAAFGLRVGGAPDRFLVGLAVLSLLSEVAEERPLLGLVDDAQWLDRASSHTLAFVARRLGAESVALVFAMRGGGSEYAGLPELLVGGLPTANARALLASVMPGPLDPRVRDCIVAETQGNPLALLELPRGSTPAKLAGGFGLPKMVPLSSRVEESFLRRVWALPAETQRLLLLAAAEPAGDPVLLWRAADRLGIGVDAGTPAEADELLYLEGRVRFRHPLVRSAVYWAAPLADRRSVHGALAAATDPEADPDRRAWHRAQATLGPDDAVADELERSAGRAQARGGLAAAAAFLERAAGLTAVAGRRGARELAAARAKLEGGASDAASELLDRAVAAPLDELQRAQVERMRAQIEFTSRRGSDAPRLLLRAARRLERLDVQLARETYLEALEAALFAGRLASGGGLVEVAEAARAAPPAPHPPRSLDLLLDGLAALLTEGYAAGVPTLRRALSAFLSEDAIRWFLFASRAASEVWDEEIALALATRQVQLARDAGALTLLPIALHYLALLRVHAGDFVAAAAAIQESDEITASTGNARIVSAHLVLAAWRGQEQQTSELIEASIRDATARGEGTVMSVADYATAVLQDSLGRYRAALAAAQRACQYEEMIPRLLPELVEAAARSGEQELAADALRRLAEQTRASGTEWALGTEARSRALLSEGRVAEDLYREAIERLSRCRAAAHLARAHLVFGEWLRRERRRLDAREQLRTAHEMFTSMGAEAFAERAARELLATGEHARRRTIETTSQLTAQETQIARLAHEGRSNPEIGAQLFISSRTVEYHLHKVFTKLDISSRNQLDRVLPVSGPVSGPCHR